MYSVRGKDGEQNGTICSGTYLGRKTGIFFNPGSSELADGAAPVQGFRLSASGEIPHNVHTVPGIPVPPPGTVPSLSHPDIPDRTGWILPCVF